jgi:hypothetical protein
MLGGPARNEIGSSPFDSGPFVDSDENNVKSFSVEEFIEASAKLEAVIK